MIPPDPMRNLGPATILRADARSLPLADNSVDLVVTSPPFFQLRSYQDGGQHYEGQLGSEPTPAQFVDALIDCTREMVRVVKPSGSIWIELGDSYSRGQRLDTEFTAHDAAWLAGVIDSDGSVSIRVDNAGRSHIAWTRVGQMRREVVERIGVVTGVGQVWQDKRGVWNWNAAAQQARWVLERIWPWLHIKQRQALAAIDLMTQKAAAKHCGRWNPLTDEDIRQRELIRQAVLAWNRGEDFPDYEPPVVELPHLPGEPVWIPTKSLIGAPWRYAVRCVDELGLILRSEVVWSRPNGLPESVTDRVRRSHSTWFHFTLQPRYYSAVDEIREPQTGSLTAQSRPEAETRDSHSGNSHRKMRRDPGMFSPLGKLPGSVWSIPTEPLRVPDHLGVDHFAAFPSEWPKRIIRGWSPAGVCTACGEGRRPVRGVDWSKLPHRMAEKRALTPAETAEWCHNFANWCDSAGITRNDLDRAAGTLDMGGWWASRLPHRAAVPTPEQWAKLRQQIEPPSRFDAVVHLTRMVPVSLMDSGDDMAITGRHRTDGHRRMASADYQAITGYACACPQPTAPTTPALILDPFGGTGTVAMVARALGRHGIHADLSADYNRLARWRITDLDQLAAVQGHERTKRQPDGDDLLTLLDDGGVA